MATSVTNGKGGIISVTSTAQLILIAPVSTAGVLQKTAMTLKVFNTGADTIYAVVNVNVVGDYVEADAIPIPSGESFPFIGQPMKNLVLATASGDTSTAHYGAY